MRGLKTLVGIGLVITAVAGLIYWEIDGRERLLTDTVLVASQDIGKDTFLTAKMISWIGVTEEVKINGALGTDSLQSLIGQKTRQLIPRNAQFTYNYLYKDDFYLKEGESIFVIKQDWISMISSSVRQGDQVGLYSQDGSIKIGSYRVAFVKDATVREVKNAASSDERNGGEYETNGGSAQTGRYETTHSSDNSDELLSRTDATSVVTYIEIITTLREYQKILQQTEKEDAAKIMIIQE